MHDGNLSFLPGLELAPAYDMLPMMYAHSPNPKNERSYMPITPQSNERIVWESAALAAVTFWLRAAHDERISAGFQRVCEENHKKLSLVLGEVRSRKL